MPDDADAPPEPDAAPAADSVPMGFWIDLCAAVRKELKPPVSGFFASSPNAPVRGVLVGNTLELRCSNAFTFQMMDKPEILDVVSRKAGAMLGRPVRAKAVDINARPSENPRMEQLLNFGRNHSDIVNIKK